MKRQLSGAVAAAFACTCAFAAQPAFTPDRFAQHIKVLASDEFEGRAPASPGEEKTIAYIVKQFRAAGLQPGGDRIAPGKRAWTQRVPLRHFTFAGPVKIGVDAAGVHSDWTQGEQMSLRPMMTGGDRLSVVNAPVVFIGYGVKAPERNWDDFKGMDLKGKVALVLVNDPDFETGVGDFGGKAMTYYGRWTYKYEEAARQGALGFLVIHETRAAGYGWNTVKNSAEDVFDFVRANPREAHAPVEGWIQRDPAAALLKAAGLDFEALKKQAQTREFKPVELQGVTFSADVPIKVEQTVSHNVVGLVPGKRRANETVLYTAHWDHLGVGLPDAKGDRIYNGAVDNASGVSMLIELARAFGKSPRTDRSVVFLASTGEEKLFLGTDYYVANPLYPLETTAADLNMDGMNVLGRSKDVSAAGNVPLTLLDHMVAVAAKHGLAYTPESHPEYGSYFRNDHFPFARVGVPAITFSGGSDLEKGGRAAADAEYEAYKRDKYHQPADEYDPKWDLSGMVQEAQVFYDLGREIANSRVWPEWKPGAEFKAIRGRSAAARN